jgi:hypothetical protein
VSRPDTAVLPIEARQAAWQRLWERLLIEPPIPGDTPESEPHTNLDDEATAEDSAVA